MLKLNLVHTVAFSGVVLFAGYGLRKFIKPLARYNIPAPVVGGRRAPSSSSPWSGRSSSTSPTR